MANPAIVVGAGAGGVDEMQAWVDDATVQWALLRFSFGEGSFRRQRVLFLHINGERCPVMHRGKMNELTTEVKSILSGGEAGKDSFHAALEVHSGSEVTAANLLERASKFFVVDDNADYSVQWLLKEYERQLQSAQRDAVKGGAGSDDAGGRKKRMPGHESADLFKTGRDALKAIGDPLGPWNWVLVGPDVENLPLLGGGAGSIDEMRDFIEENTNLVMMGLLRMSFGQGRLRRTKYVFIHATGSAVSAVQRGKQGGVRPKMEKELARFGGFSITHEILNPEELTVEDVIERVRKAAVIDDEVLEGDNAGKSMFTVEAFRQALAEEQKVAAAAVESSGGLEIKRAPGSELSLQECVKLVRAPDGSLNWALFSPNQEWIRVRKSLKPGRGSSVGPSLTPRLSMPAGASGATGGFLGAQRRASSARPPDERASVVEILVPDMTAQDSMASMASVDSDATFKKRPTGATMNWQPTAGSAIREERSTASLDRAPSDQSVTATWQGMKPAASAPPPAIMATPPPDAQTQAPASAPARSSTATLPIGKTLTVPAGVSERTQEEYLKQASKLAGPLLKKSGSMFRGWQLRWFEVRGGCLVWWDSPFETAEAPKGCQELLGMKVKCQPGSSSIFSLQTTTGKDKTYEFDVNAVAIAKYARWGDNWDATATTWVKILEQEAVRRRAW